MVIPVTVPVYLVARKDNERCSRFLDDSWARDSFSDREILVAEYLGGLIATSSTGDFSRYVYSRS